MQDTINLRTKQPSAISHPPSTNSHQPTPNT